MAMPVSTRDRGDNAAQPVRADPRRRARSRPKEPTSTSDAMHEHAARTSATSPRSPRPTCSRRSPPGSRPRCSSSLLRSQTRTIDFATSNLRGSPVELYLGGARIEASYPMGPRSGCAVNVTVLSYCGELRLGIHSDPAAITDPDLVPRLPPRRVRRRSPHCA